MKYELKLLRACLFDLSRENNLPDVTHLKSVDLDRIADEHRRMRRILEDNICKKLRGDETKYHGTKGSKRAAIEVIPNKSFRGKRPTAYYNRITIEDVKKEYQKALNCVNEAEFQAICGKISNRFAAGLRYPRGIICFLQFTFKLSRKKNPKFLAILNTDYKQDIVHFDATQVLDYLNNVFEDDFKSTILYPYIKEEIVKKRTIGEGKAKREEIETTLKIDENQLKIHIKPKFDPLIYKVAGTTEPIDIEKKVVQTYERVLSDISSFEDLEKHVKKEFKLVDLILWVGEDINFKVNAKQFTDDIRLIVTKFGEGVVVKGADVAVMLGKHNLFSEGKIKKFDPKDLEK